MGFKENARTRLLIVHSAYSVALDFAARTRLSGREWYQKHGSLGTQSFRSRQKRKRASDPYHSKNSSSSRFRSYFVDREGKIKSCSWARVQYVPRSHIFVKLEMVHWNITLHSQNGRSLEIQERENKNFFGTWRPKIGDWQIHRSYQVFRNSWGKWFLCRLFFLFFFVNCISNRKNS